MWATTEDIFNGATEMARGVVSRASREERVDNGTEGACGSVPWADKEDTAN